MLPGSCPSSQAHGSIPRPWVVLPIPLPSSHALSPSPWPSALRLGPRPFLQALTSSPRPSRIHSQASDPVPMPRMSHGHPPRPYASSLALGPPPVPWPSPRALSLLLILRSCCRSQQEAEALIPSEHFLSQMLGQISKSMSGRKWQRRERWDRAEADLRI